MRTKTGKSAANRKAFKKTDLARTIGVLLSVGCVGIVSPSVTAAQESESATLEEIIVTASRREERINEIPASIAALSSQKLIRMGATGLEDYFTAVPSLSLVDRGAGRNNVIIRGVQNDSYGLGNPTSALYFDEVPVSEESYPDLNTFDVQRIEVLRGPQGTLFGASSLGGAVRIITEKPDPSAFTAKIDTTAEGISGHGVGTRLNFMVNVPVVEDRLGVRLVGYWHDVPGFYENVNEFRPNDDAGSELMDGGRLALRWTPSDILTVDAKAIIQNQEVDGYPAEQDALPLDNLGNYQHDFASGGELVDDIEVYSLDLELDFDFATLISATSYVDQQREFVENVNRYPYYYGYSAETEDYIFGGFGPDGDIFVPVSSIVFDEHQTATQELRLVSNGDGVLDYTVGLFYSETETDGNFIDYTDPQDQSHLSALDEAACVFLFDDPCAPSYEPQTVLFNADDFGDFQTRLENLAVYGEVAYDLSEKWTVIGGFRVFDLHMESDDPTLDDYDEDGVIPKVSIQYRLNDNSMLYALYSEGFRRGEFPSSLIREDQIEELASLLDGRRPGEYLPEDQPVIDDVLLSDGNLCGAAYPNFGRQEVQSDTLRNYEIGAKMTLQDGRMQLNTTVYHIDWSNLQVIQDIDDCGTDGSAFANVSGNQGSADIFGLEVEMNYQVTDRLNVNLSAGYTDSELQVDANLLPPGNPYTLTGLSEDPLGLGGDRSPAVPELAWSFDGTYTFPVTLFSDAPLDGYLRVSYEYQGDSYTRYTERPDEQAGDYGLVDVRGGLAGDVWELALFIENVADDDRRTYVDVIPLTRGDNITRVQPRTVGMNFSYFFDF